MWYVYILKCADNTLYTGVTKNLKRRIEEHNSSKLGAKYTRGRRPVSLIYSKRKKDYSRVLKEEIKIKKLTKQDKLILIKNNQKQEKTKKLS